MAGQPVAAAGYIAVRDGIVEVMSRKSGHYKGDLRHVDQLLSRLSRLNALASKNLVIDEEI